MSNASNNYGMTQDELRSFLADQRENGFLALGQDKRLFALNFVETGSYAMASEAAMVVKDTGRRWLRDPLVSAFIAYLNQQKEHYSLIDASFVESQYLVLLAKLLGEEEVPMVNKDGAQFSAKKFHSSEAVAALRDMAKISGHYKEDSTVNVHVTNLTDDQRRILNEKLDANY